MSNNCIISLFSKIPSSGPTVMTSGNWFLDPTSSTITGLRWGIGAAPDVPPVIWATTAFAPGVQIGAGPYLFIDPDNVAAGTYKFTYRVGEIGSTCVASATITLTVVNGVTAGTALTGITYCADDITNHNISPLFSGQSAGGTWSGTGVALGPPAWVAANTTFNPSEAPVPAGQTANYTFIYSVTAAGGPHSEDCKGGYCYDNRNFQNYGHKESLRVSWNFTNYYV